MNLSPIPVETPLQKIAEAELEIYRIKQKVKLPPYEMYPDRSPSDVFFKSETAKTAIVVYNKRGVLYVI